MDQFTRKTGAKLWVSKAEKKEKKLSEPEGKDAPNEGNKARIFPQDLERWDAQVTKMGSQVMNWRCER